MQCISYMCGQLTVSAYATVVKKDDYFRQGRSQKWPKEGVLRPENAKGGDFEVAEALRTRARTSFC